MQLGKLALAIIVLLLIAGQGLPAQEGPTHDRERGQVNSQAFWRQALGGEITGLPTVQVQSVVMTLDSGSVKAYSSGGSPLWTFAARGRLSPYVTRSREGTSYISRTNGIFIAINRVGRELWRHNHHTPLSGPVVIGWDGRVFAPLGKRIVCYTASGKRLWTREFAEDIKVNPRLDKSGSIILTLANNELIRLSPFNNIKSYALAQAAHSIISLDSEKYLILYTSGSVDLFDISSSGREALPALPSPPLAAASMGSLAAICLIDGRTLLLSPSNKNVLWTSDSHINIRWRSGGRAETEAAMLFDERGVYVLSRSGATGFTDDGRRLWFTMLENTASLPAFGDDGTLYSGGRDWILYAYRLEERVREEKQSLYGPAPLGSYNMGSPPPSSWASDYLRLDEDNLKSQTNIISRAISAGNVGENEIEWTAYLMETASGEYNRPVPRAHIQYRITALRLLAQIGSQETIPFLTNIFVRDREPLIRAAAAEAIGTIGVDPDGHAFRAFIAAVSPAALVKEEQVLIAVASATGALCRFSGPPLSDTGIRILSLISTPSQPRSAQQRAQRELATLR